MSEAKLNVQGLARRDEGFVSCIVPDPGYVFVGMDLGAGEPTCTAHYSKDPMYRYATLDGIGKAPYFNTAGVLMIDDIYLMTMSTTPVGAPIIKEAWSKDWGGKSFVEQWLDKPKVIKAEFDDMRQLHKMWTLAWLYLMGANKMQKQTAEQFGISMTLSQCKESIANFWDTFRLVDKLVKSCADAAKKNGAIVNGFGYRMTFCNNGKRMEDNTHKACNYLIQSSVSGIMHLFNKHLFEECRASGCAADFITVIHDETVAQVKRDQLELFEVCKDKATARLNDTLKWTVPIRVGFTSGDTFYDIKG